MRLRVEKSLASSYAGGGRMIRHQDLGFLAWVQDSRQSNRYNTVTLYEMISRP